eukprot:gene11837-13801_t
MFRLFFKTWPTTVRVAAATAATASAATVTTFALSEEEKPAVFNVEHYGDCGLNGKFVLDQAVQKFAGGEDGGGGRFEDPELRDIAANADGILAVLKEHCDLTEGSTIADVGSGTGLFINRFSKAVGDTGRVWAVELSDVFADYLRRRARRENLHNVVVAQSDDKAVNLDMDSIDVAICIDVYHHLLFPKTFSKSVYRALRPGGKYVVIDFHRDPEIFKNGDPGHQGSWVLDHVRAGREVFLAELESVGFELVEEPEIPGMIENYVLVLQKKQEVGKA